METGRLALPVILGMLFLLLLNCLAGFGIGLIATGSTSVAAITGIGLPGVSVAALLLMWVNFRRHDQQA